MTRTSVLASAAFRGLLLTVILYHATLAYYRPTSDVLQLVRAFLLSFLLALAAFLLVRKQVVSLFPRELGLLQALALPALGLALLLFLVDALLGYLTTLKYFRTIELPVVMLGQLWCWAEHREKRSLYPEPLDRVLLHVVVFIVAVGTVELVLR
ncbi:MAG: hypothetical protein ACE5HP_04745 [Gemmatimonadota bacterium]